MSLIGPCPGAEMNHFLPGSLKLPSHSVGARWGLFYKLNRVSKWNLCVSLYLIFWRYTHKHVLSFACMTFPCRTPRCIALPLCSAEVFVAQFVVRWVGPIFRRQMPVIHVLSKTILPRAGFCIRSLMLYVQDHYPILQILAYTFSFKKDFSCEWGFCELPAVLL